MDYVGSLNWFAKYLDVLLYLCAVFLCKVLIFFVQTAFVFILMGLLQPKRTKLCCNLLFLISNRNSFHRLSHFSQGKNSFTPTPFCDSLISIQFIYLRVSAELIIDRLPTFLANTPLVPFLQKFLIFQSSLFIIQFQISTGICIILKMYYISYPPRSTTFLKKRCRSTEKRQY